MVAKMFPAFISRMVYLLAILALIGAPAAAQTGGELEVLNMFYSEKELTVVSATRAPRPINEIAENMSVITAEQIRMMNAHTLGEVLARVPGVFVAGNGDFSDNSAASIQGSNTEGHIRVLVDGMTWNQLSGRNALFFTIPVEIIDRIEVVKGPASSAWGSALGGVINIITKPVGHNAAPEGIVSASYGEADSQDYRAAASGAVGPAGYYLFAGHQRSDGLRDDRAFETDTLFGKFSMPVTDILELSLSTAYSNPLKKDGTSLTPYPITFQYNARTFFVQAMADARLSPAFSVNVLAYHYEQRMSIPAWALDPSGDQAEKLYEDIYEEETLGVNARLTWKSRFQTLAAGVDFESGQLDQFSIDPAGRLTFKSDEDRWAVYANDTFTFGRWRVTPGIRYDDLDTSGGFLSPSLGIAYEPWDGTVFRASAARGFNAPGLSLTQGGSWNLAPNPDLEPETVRSYQGGVETRAIPYCWVKLSLFYHDVEKLLVRTPFDGSSDKILNIGEAVRQGVELAMETAPYLGISALGSLSYYEQDEQGSEKAGDKRYSFNTGVRYGSETIRADIFGRYIWWDQEDTGLGGSYDDMIVDLNVSYAPDVDFAVKPEIFSTVHNLFDGEQYSAFWKRNPGRWAEVGMRFRF